MPLLPYAYGPNSLCSKGMHQQEMEDRRERPNLLISGPSSAKDEDSWKIILSPSLPTHPTSPRSRIYPFPIMFQLRKSATKAERLCGLLKVTQPARSRPR